MACVVALLTLQTQSTVKVSPVLFHREKSFLMQVCMQAEYKLLKSNIPFEL